MIYEIVIPIDLNKNLEKSIYYFIDIFEKNKSLITHEDVINTIKLLVKCNKLDMEIDDYKKICVMAFQYIKEEINNQKFEFKYWYKLFKVNSPLNFKRLYIMKLFNEIWENNYVE